MQIEKMRKPKVRLRTKQERLWMKCLLFSMENGRMRMTTALREVKGMVGELGGILALDEAAEG